MVSDAFKVFGDHQNIKRLLAPGRIACQKRNQLGLHAHEQIVHYVVGRHDRLCQVYITGNVRVNHLVYHIDGFMCHIAHQAGIVQALHAVHHGHDFADVGGLIADSLHIGNHLQRRADLAQIPRDGLLHQQKPEAHALDGAFLLIDEVIGLHHAFGQRHVVAHQRVARLVDGAFDHRAHGDHLPGQFLQLFVKLTAHISRTSL